MTSFVLDASVALAWLVDRSIDPYAARVKQLLLRGSRAIVPSLWQLEMANGFVTAERRGILTPADTTEILENFEIVLGGSIEIRHEPMLVRRAIAAARESDLTAYDAAYLELARDHGLPIATLDRRLAASAKKANVPLLQ
jgi:predicted nucleic acid-binding protein